MVPDYSRYANSKSEPNLKSADFLTEARQFLDEMRLAQSHPSSPTKRLTKASSTMPCARLIWSPMAALFLLQYKCLQTLSPRQEQRLPHRLVGANRRNIVVLTQVNL